MNISLPRGELLSALQSVMGAVERRNSLPILSNILMVVRDDQLTLTATDLEIQLERHVLVQNIVPGEVTVPGRKLYDICRGLPEGATVTLETAPNNRLTVKSGRSRFALATLPAGDFPRLNAKASETTLKFKAGDLHDLMGRVMFAMAQQDVRYYLNGLLLDVTSERARAVATDGHRLAMSELTLPMSVSRPLQIIVPRKSVVEIQRLLDADSRESEVSLGITANQIKLELDGVSVISKLIEGRFPDYERVIPSEPDKTLRGDRTRVRAALARAAILSNEKFRGIRLQARGNNLLLQTQNPEQEEAQEEIDVHYDGKDIEIGFNVSYLLDALDAVEGQEFVLEMRNADTSGLLYDPGRPGNKYVVMPMRLA